VICTL
jgi:hypothetical protein